MFSFSGVGLIHMEMHTVRHESSHDNDDGGGGGNKRSTPAKHNPRRKRERKITEKAKINGIYCFPTRVVKS